MDLVGLLVGDLKAELLLAKWSDLFWAIFSEEKDWGAYLLNGHHYLDGVQAVKTEVVREVGGAVDLMVDRC